MSGLGAFLRAAREHRGITIREAEELSGLSNTYISKMENGQVHEPTPEVLRKISRLYHIPYELLLLKAGFQIHKFQNSTEKNNTKVSILIVDDDHRDRELIKIYLENEKSFDYTIDEAATGEEAFSAVKNKIPDCVFVDYRLPDIDGLQLMAKMKQIESMKTTSFVIMTGQGREEIAAAAIRMGAVNYLTKDKINGETIGITVHHALHRRSMLQNIKSTLAREKKHRENTWALVFRMANHIRKAVERIIENNENLRGDPDVMLIMEKSIELTEIAGIENASITNTRN